MKINTLLKSYLIFFLIQILTVAISTAQNTFRADSLYKSGSYKLASEEYILIYNSASHTEIERGNAAFKVGRCYNILNRLDEAIEWHNKASILFKSSKNIDDYHLAQAQIASINDDKGLYKEAIDLAWVSANYFINKKDSSYAAEILNNIGLYQYHNQEVQQSIKTYDSAILWAGAKRKDIAAKCYNQLGNIWAVNLANEQKALEYYAKSLAMKLESDATAKSISSSYNNLGISYKNLGKLDSSIYSYTKALEYARLTNDPATQINPLINIGNIQKRNFDYEGANRTFEQALALSQYATMRELTTLHINMAMNYNQLKKHTQALKHLQIADTLIQRSQRLIDWRDLRAQKAIAYAGMHNFEEAFKEQIKLTAINDSIYLLEKEQEMADIMLKYETEQKDKELLEKQQIIQSQEIISKRKTIIIISTAAILIVLSGFVYYVYKQKLALAKQANLERKLTEEKKRADLQEERLRISRELHDNIGSYLTLISASIENIPAMSTEKLKTHYPDLQNTLNLSIRELRKTVWLLSSNEISIEALALRIRDFFKPLQKNGPKIIIETIGNEASIISDIQATHIFRIIQEAINNAIKYAKATVIEVKINSSENIEFSITDNGIGFDMHTTNAGNGLQNMHVRIKELNGTLNINSQSNNGTRIIGCFPLNT